MWRTQMNLQAIIYGSFTFIHFNCKLCFIWRKWIALKMSNRTWDAAGVSVWTVGQLIQKSPFPSFMIILALWTIYSLRWYFHNRQRRSPGIQSSSAVFSPSSHEQHPSFPTCDLSLIYNLSCSFCILGFGEVSQFNYLKMLWICMFIHTAQNDLLLFV